MELPVPASEPDQPTEGASQPCVAPECKWHRRASQRPEELFLAALVEFGEKGYRCTRLDDIAHRAGVTKPLIYHYFKDKDDLLLKALDWKIGLILADMRAESGPSEEDTQTRLRRIFEYFWARWQRPEWGRFHGTLLVEMRSESPELFRKWVEGALVERWKVVEEILREGQRRGEVREDLDPVAASRYLISGGVQLAWLHLHTSIQDFAPCPEASLRETALTIFLRGIRPDQDRAKED
jgi:AcrR family transcriptional regulator